MIIRRLLLGLLVLVVAGVAGFAILAWRPALHPIDPAAAAKPDPSRFVQGARLAQVGDCMVCHTRPDAEPYSGAAPPAIPFGTIYATNVTPDPGTGIGRWSEAALCRPMRCPFRWASARSWPDGSGCSWKGRHRCRAIRQRMRRGTVVPIWSRRSPVAVPATPR